MGNTSVGNTSELELGPLTVNMSGVYKCFAYNSITNQSSFAEKMLKVLGVYHTNVLPNAYSDSVNAYHICAMNYNFIWSW